MSAAAASIAAAPRAAVAAPGRTQPSSRGANKIRAYCPRHPASLSIRRRSTVQAVTLASVNDDGAKDDAPAVSLNRRHLLSQGSLAAAAILSSQGWASAAQAGAYTRPLLSSS